MTLRNTVFFVQVFLFTAVLCNVENTPCVTPNGENATCMPILSCKIILQALLNSTNEIRAFAKQSQCGFNTRPLVCCGTASTFKYEINPPESTFLPDKQSCGRFSVSNRLIGGELTELTEFPWTALLGYEDTEKNSSAGFKCGGTLISNRYVLTAAHCLSVATSTGFAAKFVRLGEWKISTETDCEMTKIDDYCADPVIDLEIQSMAIHPNYSRRSGINDIALIKLNQTVKFSVFVQPICLISSNDPGLKTGEFLHTTGWGSTETAATSDVKLKVRLPVVSEEECRKTYSAIGTNILDTHICAGGEAGKDSCRGDSGGPIMKNVLDSINQKDQWFLEGVTSSGAGCGRRGIPGIYTKVSKYADWIVSNLEDSVIS